MADINQVPGFSKRALDGLHPSQGFIVTEFLLINRRKHYNKEPLDPKFVKKYPQYRGKQVWEFYREEFNDPNGVGYGWLRDVKARSGR